MRARLSVSMGGRAAEEIIYGNDNVTSGCSSDLLGATRIAREMVTKYGMSDKFGFIAQSYEDMSEEGKKLVDEEVKKLLDV